MTRTVQAMVEVDLDDFSDDEILKEAHARSLIGRDEEAISELANAIERESKVDALACLANIVRGQTPLVEAMERGRRRRV